MLWVIMCLFSFPAWPYDLLHSKHICIIFSLLVRVQYLFSVLRGLGPHCIVALQRAFYWYTFYWDIQTIPSETILTFTFWKPFYFVSFWATENFVMRLSILHHFKISEDTPFFHKLFKRANLTQALIVDYWMLSTHKDYISIGNTCAICFVLEAAVEET